MLSDNWISDQIRRAAGEVESAGGTLRGFERVVEFRWADHPLYGWETLLRTRGLR